MCELLGFSAAEKHDISKQMIEFFSHSNINPHGWGLMLDDDIFKGCEKADDSKELHKVLSNREKYRTVMGHIRFATVGSISPQNCHPFTACDITGRRWTLIHNGTIYKGSRLVRFMTTQQGDTDSERMFLYMMECFDRAQIHGGLCAHDRFELMDRLVRELSVSNKLNLMIYDGELLYIHKNMKQTMMYRKLDSGYIFSTYPLDDEEWSDVEMTRLYAYKNGELAFKGIKHNAYFEPTLQYIKATDAMNI